MAAGLEMWRILGLFCLFSVVVHAKEKAVPVRLTEETWQNMLEGEWMVEFYAPWCPACKALGPTWESLAGWSDDLGIQVASIDVTENPGLSGRFLVTALPTIYHVKDGSFRLYRGSRAENDFISFVDDKKWEEIDPLAWYFSPTSIHMSAMAMFFKLSISIRNVHNMMTEEFGIPVWGSYTIFAVATILVGLLLGLVVVCMCDVVFPPKYAAPPLERKVHLATDQSSGDKDDDDESDVIEDDRYDAVDPSAAAAAASGGDARPKTARRRVPRTE